MHCPNCGHKTTTEQKYCRACGLSLERVTQLLAELGPPAHDVAAHGKGDERLRRYAERAGLALLAGGGLVFFVAIYWVIITKIIIGKGELLTGTIFLALLTALVFGGLLLSYASSARKSAPTPPPTLPPDEPAARQLPEPHFEPVPSVTERTTDLLAVEHRNAKG